MTTTLRRALAALILGILCTLAVASTATAQASAPVNLVPPTILGDPVQGKLLFAWPGHWSGTPPLTFAYQWQRCDAGGGGCADIAGATTNTYTATAGDVGHRLRAGVGATNTTGAAAVLSEPSAVIAALVPVSEPAVVHAAKDACKHDGWRWLVHPSFRNQGQCVSFNVSHRGDRHDHGQDKDD